MKWNTRVSASVLVLWVASASSGADWPQWRGPNRDGKSQETALMKRWPAQGPVQRWIYRGLGEGFGSVAVADGLVYVAGMTRGTGVLTAIGLDGRRRWRKEYGPEWTGGPPGVRTTPTVDSGRVYVMSGRGRLACFDAKTGDEKWAVDAVQRFRGRVPSWGMAESVLVVGANVICTPGGPGASVVALEKGSGELVWQTKDLSQKSAYCSPILVRRGNRQLIVTMVHDYIVGLDAATGGLLWRRKHKTSYDVHAVSPLSIDGHVYATSGYGTGGVLLELSDDGRTVTPKWHDGTLDNHHGGVVRVDGVICGSTYKGRWVCLNVKTGKPEWQGRGVRKGSVIYADGMLYCYGEGGTVALAKPSAQGLRVVSRFRVREGKKQHWAHPAISDGRLYIRHGDVLMAYDIKQR